LWKTDAAVRAHSRLDNVNSLETKQSRRNSNFCSSFRADMFFALRRHLKLVLVTFYFINILVYNFVDINELSF